MTTYTLTILDVGGIQGYLFASNRMAHNIGASWLVEQATSLAKDGWITQALINAGLQCNGNPISQASVDAEVVYSGGGNAVLLFKDMPSAKAFAREHSKLVLERASGLRVVIHHTEVDWSKPLSAAYMQAIQDLAAKKASQPYFMPLPALSVTATCEYTGLPAIEWVEDQDQKPHLVSAEIFDKHKARKNARQTWHTQFAELLGDEYTFTDEFDRFGEDGKQYIAVVHADGNGIGKRKEALCAKYPLATQNREFVTALHRFSAQMQEAGKTALDRTVRHLIDWIETDWQRDEKQHVFKRNRDRDGKMLLPFLPLVYGGDDVTVVCDGRMGLSFAALYLQHFHKQPIDGSQPLYACAGVAIVKNRYPFSQAYEMAESLTGEAKRAVYLYKKESGQDAMALDWHYAVSGAVRDVKGIRKAEYELGDGMKLHARPRFIESGGKPLQSWKAFRETVAAFTADEWKDKRNKVKALREWLRGGPQTVSINLKAFEIGKLPEIRGLDSAAQVKASETGWLGSTCAYFDAIEAMDLFIDLEPKLP